MTGTADEPAVVTGVTGGSHGMAVAVEHALVLAASYDRAGDLLREWAADSGRALVDDDLLASAVFSPGSFAEAEAALLSATTGPHGVLTASATWEVTALAIRTAVRAVEVTDDVVAHSFGALLVPDTSTAAGLLSRLYTDGRPVTTPSALVVPGSDKRAADLAGLLHHLDTVGRLADEARGRGTVEVQTIREAEGSVRHVVYLPGTDDLLTTPRAQDTDVRDLGTNLLLVSGRRNAYQRGVLDALAQAGVRPGEPVALVGHSQGGLVAAAIASQGSPYSVTHVVTAGSPVAGVGGYLEGVEVLSLEEVGDAVPLLDGDDNPDSAEQVTVTFDDHVTGVVDAHRLDHYVAGALALEDSTDPSVVDQLAALERAGFVGPDRGEQVHSQVFRITRAG